MAYITSEQVKEMRQQIKKAFPSKLGWKFSITQKDSSCIRVNIMTAPIELRDANYENNREGMTVRPGWDTLNSVGNEVVKVIWDIINGGNFDNSDSMTDYFHVGWYANVYIGKWDKPFELSNIVIDNPLKESLIKKAA